MMTTKILYPRPECSTNSSWLVSVIPNWAAHSAVCLRWQTDHGVWWTVLSRKVQYLVHSVLSHSLDITGTIRQRDVSPHLYADDTQLRASSRREDWGRSLPDHEATARKLRHGH